VFAAPLGVARKIDSHTVEIETPRPSPAGVFLENVNAVRIMSKAWCEKHGALKPQDFKTGEETYSSRHANGTGPYTLVKREAEVMTQLKKNPDWWGLADRRFEGNIDEVGLSPDQVGRDAHGGAHGRRASWTWCSIRRCRTSAA
jgi:peptide/nickel transport system substrate-binding protein